MFMPPGESFSAPDRPSLFSLELKLIGSKVRKKNRRSRISDLAYCRPDLPFLFPGSSASFSSSFLSSGIFNSILQFLHTILPCRLVIAITDFPKKHASGQVEKFRKKPPTPTSTRTSKTCHTKHLPQPAPKPNTTSHTC